MLTAVVTGTHQGLGRAFVNELDRLGFRGLAASHALANADGQRRDISTSVTELPLDVTDPVLVRTLAETIESRAGTLGLLVNNAAVNRDKGVPHDGSVHPW